jgi:hypothetical protein
VTLFVQTVIKLELIRERKKMSLEEQIKQILFDMTTTIKFHKVANDNVIMEIDYDKYVSELKSILEGYISTP